MSAKSKSIIPFIVFTTILIFWEIGVSTKLINSFILPAPHKIFTAFYEMLINREILIHVGQSFYRVFVGFALSIAIGIPLGMLIYEFKILNLIFTPILSFLKPIPPIAWMPLSLLFFGLGNGPAYFLTFISSFGPLVFNTYWAIDDISKDHLDVGRCFNLSILNRWRYILIPASLPKILDSIRLAFSLSWMAVVAAEMISAQNGLGHLITSAQDTLRSDLVILGMLLIGLIGFCFDYLMKFLIKTLFPWKNA